ncbi:MAG: hypothetical protein QME96_12065 [Myxococcota bacterium]|nr:hypothetical protein [Myxococcota bacterium]
MIDRSGFSETSEHVTPCGALRAMEFRPQDRFDGVRAFAAALLVAQAELPPSSA